MAGNPKKSQELLLKYDTPAVLTGAYQRWACPLSQAAIDMMHHTTLRCRGCSELLPPSGRQSCAVRSPYRRCTRITLCHHRAMPLPSRNEHPYRPLICRVGFAVPPSDRYRENKLQRHPQSTYVHIPCRLLAGASTILDHLHRRSGICGISIILRASLTNS